MEDWIFELIEQAGYIGIFLLMLLETVFPSIPSEVIMPVAGLSAASGTPPLGGVIVPGTAGAMAGNVVWYLLARTIGIDRFRDLSPKKWTSNYATRSSACSVVRYPRAEWRR